MVTAYPRVNSNTNKHLESRFEETRRKTWHVCAAACWFWHVHKALRLLGWRWGSFAAEIPITRPWFAGRGCTRSCIFQAGLREVSSPEMCFHVFIFGKRVHLVLATQKRQN